MTFDHIIVGGGSAGAVLAKMHHDVPLEQTALVGVRPTQGTFGIPAAQVIAGSSTALGFMAVQSAQNVTMSKGKN